MEELLTLLALRLAQLLGFVTVLMLAIGSALAIWNLVTGAFSGRTPAAVTLVVWQGLSRWILVALQFLLAADLVETIATPTWQVLGKLGVVALIRTVLGYYLTRDIEAARRIAEEEAAREREREPARRAA